MALSAVLLGCLYRHAVGLIATVARWGWPVLSRWLSRHMKQPRDVLRFEVVSDLPGGLKELRVHNGHVFGSLRCINGPLFPVGVVDVKLSMTFKFAFMDLVVDVNRNIGRDTAVDIPFCASLPLDVATEIAEMGVNTTLRLIIKVARVTVKDPWYDKVFTDHFPAITDTWFRSPM